MTGTKVIINRLRNSALEIAGRGLSGWGNAMSDAADELDRLTADCEKFANQTFKAKAEAKTLVDHANAERDALRDAAEALLSNEEHAVSGGMRSYQVGSFTHELWEDLRRAALAKDKS